MSAIKKLATFMIMIVVINSGLNGCATTDPYTGEKESTKATTGSVFGAIAGALLGSATSSKSDRKRGMIVGAGIGALTGGAVGHYMDKQEDELRQQLRDTGVSVTRDGDNIILNMPSNITFDFDSYKLKPRFKPTLDSVALVLKKYQKTLITIEGHTDSTGPDAYNQKLSENRALSVADYLLNQGIARERLAAIGKGENEPVADNSTEQGRARNRRVELMLEPVVEN